MNTRLEIYRLAARHSLDAQGTRRLEQLAGIGREPAALTHWLARSLALLAAALGGMGIILWLAANWETLGRFGRFALLQGFVLTMCLGAILQPKARAALGLLALLSIGGLFAYFGQTYQTGADAWQLFALWAVLALPLCLALRSDVLWAPWALVAATGISLWTYAHTGHRWRVEPGDLAAHALGWMAAMLLVAALSRLCRPLTGAGVWALRTAATLAVVMVTLTALGGLFARELAPHYTLGLFCLAVATGALALRALFDLYALSATALGLIAVLVGGLVRFLFLGNHGDSLGSLLLLGMAAAGLLAAAVNLILRLARHYGATQANE